ncbi:MAG: hypothetical protein IKK28_02055 [Mogibacterium sp.]|nr:hypothetical protein [Mogibacterium sp.]
MDIRTELQGRILYLEDMDGLTVAGSISSPTRITLSTAGGAKILGSIHYADFSGLITLNLSKILQASVSPRVPDDEWDSNTEQALDLVFKVANASYVQEYSFQLNCFSKDALNMITDIDQLAVPMEPMLALPLTVHTPATQVRILRELERSVNELSIENCTDPLLGVSSKIIYLNTVADNSPFRLLVTTDEGLELRSPVYTPVPGDFELFLFRNRFGAFELFPMSGNLVMTPDYKFDVSKVGGMANSTIKTEEVTLTQHSGPLTRKASKVLTSMLADGCAFHYVDDQWKRIIITEIKSSLRKYDTLHRQSFSFRYAEPTELRNINI